MADSTATTCNPWRRADTRRRATARSRSASPTEVPPNFHTTRLPGQALAYLTGKLEILRIREEARGRLGPAFSLAAFHAAVLDHGSLPMPTLARSIAGWLDRAG